MIKVYGPYQRVDGRRHVIHYDTTLKTRRTQSYPRYLVEQSLGRKLEAWEEVDHIDDDHTNDTLDNFQILTGQKNKRKAIPHALWLDFDCPVCGQSFMLRESQYKHNQLVQGKAGPYCSKQCAGKVHH